MLPLRLSLRASAFRASGKAAQHDNSWLSGNHRSATFFGRVCALLLVFVLAATPPAHTWGSEGHVWINHAAAKKLPDSMPRFLRDAADRLSYLGPEPDRWRSTMEPFLKTAQEADHYIDFERLDWLPQLPVGRYEFLKRLYERRATMSGPQADELLPEKVGLQPYITMEVYERLKAAFREYRTLKAAGKNTRDVEHAAVFYAGWLGHYVADGSQPLHTTIHFNGWVGENPQGYSTKNDIHWKFESIFVATNLTEKQFATLLQDPVKLSNVFQDYVSYLRQSLALVPALYELEKKGAFEGKGSPESVEFTRQRLAAGAQMLMNMWYTAWLESAQPLPARTPRATPTEQQPPATPKPGV
ncbi:MAG: nuclease [Acidobacteriales bacterium]|nr:nuclease [Terriglobales bacterium]